VTDEKQSTKPPAPTEKKLGDHGQCEAFDWIPTEDDAVYVQCANQGRRISERDYLTGYLRWRIVCPLHGLTSAMEVN
jgi:hypothetical protein